MRMKFWLVLFWAAVFAPTCVLAGESSAILGTEDYFAGALPPPGFHFINYLAYYNADEMMDANGDKLPIDFKADVVADVLRGIYVSDITILGASLGWHVVVPVVYQDIEVKGAFDEDHFGIGDIYFSPFLLGWHSDIFHCVLGLDIIAPTGQYSKSDNAPIGSNHWTFEPAFAASMIHPSGLSASVKLMYDIHTENDDNKLKTGQQFHLDYNVGMMIVEPLRLGICGYYLKGLQNDEVSGSKVSDSKEQVLAVGPSAMLSLSPTMHLVGKVQFEMEAENRSEGTFSWLKLIYSF